MPYPYVVKNTGLPGFTVIDPESGETLLVDIDYDYTGLASRLGWSPCHGSTDGTIDCPECGKTADDLISEAYDHLMENEHEEAEGLLDYFPESEEECSGCNPACFLCGGPGLALGSGTFRCRNCGWTWRPGSKLADQPGGGEND